MTAWISSPLSVAIRTAIRTLGFLLHRAIPLRRRTRRLLRRHSTVSSSAASAAARFRNPTSKSADLDQHDYNRLMCALAHSGDVSGVLRLLRRVRESACGANVQCYTTAMRALASAGRAADAEKVFEEMLDSGVSPDLAAYTLLVKVYACHLQRLDSAYGVMTWMARRGCPPDVVTYSTLIAGLCHSGKVGEAWEVFDEMLQRNCKPNAHTYTPILQFYCSEGRIEEAKKLLESMKNTGCTPDTVVYNTLIQGLCKVGNFDEVESIIGESARNGWEPDSITYSTYIAGLCKVGKTEEAFCQLDIMLEKGLRPTTIGLNILLDCVGQEIDVWNSKTLLERCSELGFEVDVVGYNTVMSQLSKLGRWFDVLKVFTGLFKKGIEPNNHSLNILISSLCRAGNFRMARFILCSKGFVVDIVTCNILIHEFYHAGRVDELSFLFSELDVGRIAPDTITYSTLTDCLCRNGKIFEAVDFVRSIENGYPPMPAAHLTYWLVRSGNIKEAIRLIEEMLKQGPDALK
ncbi:Pentatricopeptide repeat-containing protein [Ananas comosus]|uniref:Pentatricopeptide repeat-containing protein n=1 Tax=Ananas comosus TaxID=4615 RepID=A0A199W9N5_ANACO|nr:Pentatricopeptide repeat-containing protein [Ananas comosus]